MQKYNSARSCRWWNISRVSLKKVELYNMKSSHQYRIGNKRSDPRGMEPGSRSLKMEFNGSSSIKDDPRESDNVIVAKP